MKFSIKLLGDSSEEKLEALRGKVWIMFQFIDCAGVSSSSDLSKSDLTGANLIDATWNNTTCPDRTNSDHSANTICVFKI